jgi:pimeloyl-ACP methyl ester carboxylesterase
VRWLCRELGLRRPILVGHSLGGIIGVELSRDTPAILSGVVTLDGAICLPEAAWKGLAGLIEGLHGDDWRNHIVHGIGGYADPTRNPQRHRYLLDRATSAQQLTFTRAFDTVAHWGAGAALSASRLPLLYVASMLPVDEDQLLRLKPDARLERVKAGHYPHVEALDDVIRVIDPFLSAVAR